MIEQLKQTEMKLDQLIDIIDSKLESDIRAKNRKRHNAYARKVYSKLSYEMDYGYTLQEIGDSLGCPHHLIYFNKRTFDVINDKYKEVYNEIIDQYNLKVSKVYIKVTPIPNTTISVKTSIINALNDMSDSDVLDFRETRLKPYVNMLKSRR